MFRKLRALMKLKIFIALCGTLIGYQTAFGCSDPAMIDQLTSIETQKLLSNAPTFKHAWQDKAITIKLKDSKAEGGQCIISLQVKLPQADLDEANQHLDQNPAKKILSTAQGYSVPDSANVEVPFIYKIIDGKVLPNDPNTPELKALHNNIEYTYQQKMKKYEPFENIVFVDTLDNLGFGFEGKQNSFEGFGLSLERSYYRDWETDRKSVV